MKASRKIINILHLPSILLHELSHAFVSLLCFRMVNDIWIFRRYNNIEKEPGYIYVSGYTIFNKPAKNFLIQILVSLSPFIVLFLFAALSFISVYFIIGVVYFFLTFTTSLPSKGDYQNIEIYRDLKKHNFDDLYYNHLLSKKYDII
jgi:hypothetical protein